MMDGAARPVSLTVDGIAHSPDRLSRVDEGLSLQSLIAVRQTSGHPVLITRASAVVGVCCEADIMSALAAGGSAGPSP
jgi:hypothetical protein